MPARTARRSAARLPRRVNRPTSAAIPESHGDGFVGRDCIGGQDEDQWEQQIDPVARILTQEGPREGSEHGPLDGGHRGGCRSARTVTGHHQAVDEVDQAVERSSSAHEVTDHQHVRVRSLNRSPSHDPCRMRGRTSRCVRRRSDGVHERDLWAVPQDAGPLTTTSIRGERADQNLHQSALAAAILPGQSNDLTGAQGDQGGAGRFIGRRRVLRLAAIPTPASRTNNQGMQRFTSITSPVASGVQMSHGKGRKPIRNRDFYH